MCLLHIYLRANSVLFSAWIYLVSQIGDTIDLVSNQLQTLRNLVVPLKEFMGDPEKMALISREDQRTQYIKQDVHRQLRMFSDLDLEDQVVHNLARKELAEKTSQIASLSDLQVSKQSSVAMVSFALHLLNRVQFRQALKEQYL